SLRCIYTLSLHAALPIYYNETGAIPCVQRAPGEIASFFVGLELVEPGVVSCPRWRPEDPAGDPPAEVDAFGGVGSKPTKKLAIRSEEHTSELQSRGHIVC